VTRAPKVTIGLPVRNGARTLDRALTSLRAQTERDIEILVADNASTDETVAVAERHGAADPRVRIHRHPSNVGITANFEFVLRRARGRYFAWAAHDDVWDAAFLETLVGALEADGSAQSAMCATRRVTEDGRDVDEVRFVGARDAARPWWRLSLDVARGSPHHLFICGVHRTEFLRSLADPLPRVAAGDRLFALALVLSTPLAYRDELLYRREISDRDIRERYADEEIGQWWSSSFASLQAAAALGPYLVRSRTIPWWRKSFVPVLVVEFAARRIPLMGLLRRLRHTAGR